MEYIDNVHAKQKILAERIVALAESKLATSDPDELDGIDMKMNILSEGMFHEVFLSHSSWKSDRKDLARRIAGGTGIEKFMPEYFRFLDVVYQDNPAEADRIFRITVMNYAEGYLEILGKK